MRSTLRTLLRPLALGVPFVVVPAGVVGAPLLLACGCPTPTSTSHRYDVESTGGEAETRTCEEICASHEVETRSCRFVEPNVVECNTVVGDRCYAGRLPLGTASRRASPVSAARPRWLLETATLELAAVTAFEELSRSLEAHGAPNALVVSARRAARDEVRHARLLVSLAGRDGHARASVETCVTPPPTLEALAFHNAAEGCVREALAALEAAHQASHAADAALRGVMAGIARDEARHALLSFAIDDWARARLGVRGAARLDDARRAAAASIDDTEAPPELGLFSPDLRARLAAAA